MQEIVALLVVVVIWAVFWFKMFYLLKSTWFDRIISSLALGVRVMIMAIIVGIFVPNIFLDGFWLLLTKSLTMSWVLVLALYVGANF